VRDACTGVAVSNLAVSVTDSTASTSAPSKMSSGAFQFASLDGSGLMLHVTAPGYAPLGDPTSPNPGVPVHQEPGPINRPVAPVLLPGGVRWNMGERLAIMLTPTAGCAKPRLPAVQALTATVRDLTTGLAIPGLNVAISPDPGSPTAAEPGPIALGSGMFSVKSLTCGTYDLTIGASGYNPLGAGEATVTHHAATATCDGAVPSGAIAYGTVLNVQLPPTGFDQAPVIRWIKVPSTTVHVGDTFTISAGASDPDGDPLVGTLTSNNPNLSCTPTGESNGGELTRQCVELDGVVVGGVNSVDGIETETETVEFKDPQGAVATQTIHLSVFPTATTTTTTSTVAGP